MRVVFCILLGLGLTTADAYGQLDYERAPIHYSETEPVDAVAKLSARLKAGSGQLHYDEAHGYLSSLLAELKIPKSSQTLVFSKTSLQIGRINPRKPRAIYFNDDVYVGWVQQGDLVEISAADPQLGGTFYTLSQREVRSPKIERETSRCLQCHGSTHTRRTPGHIVRSVYSDSSGQPVFRLGTHLSDHSSEFEERFGGWFVSGTHGDMRHMGNAWLADPDVSEELDVDRNANVIDLSPLVDVSPYLTPHSDIVALMVLQHQAHMHNVLTAANHSGRITARDAITMNKALERAADFESESTQRRYASAAEKVVRALLFVDEAPLTDVVKGTSGFTDDFAKPGPFDAAGRSLRQFDLQTRLFRFPCSYLIYSDSFRSLPDGVAQRVQQRLREVLSGTDMSEEFRHLTADDRRALMEILTETGGLGAVPGEVSLR